MAAIQARAISEMSHYMDYEESRQSFAQRLVDDHDETQEELKNLAFYNNELYIKRDNLYSSLPTKIFNRKMKDKPVKTIE